jgi:ribonuclease P protein component
MHTASLKKKERICSKLRIQNIFEKGEKVFSYPFFFAYQVASAEQTLVEVMIGVSKKKFKRAVDRNRIKRLCRELYRLHKSQLTADLSQGAPLQLSLSITFVGSKMPEYKSLQTQYRKALIQLVNEITKTAVQTL